MSTDLGLYTWRKDSEEGYSSHLPPDQTGIHGFLLHFYQDKDDRTIGVLLNGIKLVKVPYHLLTFDRWS
jgi:hypothetical protein